MLNKINLKEMEKKAFQDSNQDGQIEFVFRVIFFSITGYSLFFIFLLSNKLSI